MLHLVLIIILRLIKLNINIKSKKRDYRQFRLDYLLLGDDEVGHHYAIELSVEMVLLIQGLEQDEEDHPDHKQEKNVCCDHHYFDCRLCV
jgi:hypothetical protein